MGAATDLLDRASPRITPVQNPNNSEILPMSTDAGGDTEADKGVRILSLEKDSGGPGAYSQLLIIKEYMVRLANDLDIDEADVYPANYFDLMGGVGFGGLVAILLGHLRMNVEEAIESLLDIALAIFPDDPRPNSDLEIRTTRLTESMQNMLQTRGIPSDRKMQEKGEESGRCKVALYAATTANISHPIVLRTYKPRGSSINPTIVEAICATMATPSYFSPVKIGPRGRQQTFIGGPRGVNNPTRALLKEASSIFGKEKLVVQVLSLGCGRSRVPSMDTFTDTDGVCRLVQEMAADCEIEESELSARLYDVDAYLRLNVDRGMEKLLMREWHQLGHIETHTNAYLEAPTILEYFEASLRRLQEGTGTITLGQLNHPSTAKDTQDKLGKRIEDLDRVVRDLRDTAEESDLLKRLDPFKAANYDEDRSCMEGTRTKILENIVAWAIFPLDDETRSNRSNSSVLWLYSMPGLGKTSVANSLCDRLRRAESLGACFFCKHDNADLRDPKRVLPTLIAKLAQMWSPFRKLVAKVLLDEPQINPESTRGELLLKPLQLLKKHPARTLVLVIDAIDECGQPNARGLLLSCLIEACTLVHWLRIVVTSRPEPDIQSFFDRHHITSRDLATDDINGHDIRLFTERRMASVASRRHLSPDWPGAKRVGQIVERSRGLFIFVDTLSRLVDVPKPEPLLVQVLNGKLEEANAELHKLYSTVITSRAVGNIEDMQSMLRAVIAVSAYRPLCAETLAKLIDLEVPTILSWLDELSSLLYQDAAGENGIRVRHLSVLEFLVGSTCPPMLRVDQKLANIELTRCCLATMSNELQFNICGLETACLLNADIPDLNNRVRQRIPDTLQYSCMHWASHLCYDIDLVSTEITGLLDGFFAESQPLYWIEVLSLMGKVPAAISSARLMKACFKKFEAHHRRLIEDILRFLLAFFTPISTSTPHIYISALPFMPIESDLWKHASLSFPETIDVYKGRTESWPAPSSTWVGHTIHICSVAYSPNGQNVVSGSKDDTIRIWDAETGAAVGKPLTGHTGGVWSVAYSPNGRNIVSGSSDGTIRIWDAETGAAVGKPLTGHTGSVRSVFYLPNGWGTVSSSDNKPIPPWDAQTETPLGKPLEGYTYHIRSVAYSSDGRNIVSGSSDRMIRIWDVQTGAVVGKPCAGHMDEIWSVAYSPDGRNIVSGSYDYTIRIWDAQTGTAVGKPFTGHTSSVLSVTYSPDGRNVVSGSDDKTIRIWDVQTGTAVGQPLTGHTYSVNSATYSPDGRHIVSGSSDRTIRIWDAETGAAVGQPLIGHHEGIQSVAYSPYGRNVVSGSDDKMIRIWDTQTGAAVGKPLTGHTGWVTSVAYSPGGLSVVSGSTDGTVQISDAQTGETRGQPLIGHTKWVNSVACPPNGLNIVSGSKDTTIRIWDAKAKVSVGRPLAGHTEAVLSVAYSPDSQNIVSGSDDMTVRIWDAQNGVAVGQPLKGHFSAVSSVAYSPDGQKVVSGSYDATIRIWDAQTGAPMLQLLTEWVNSVAYSPDGLNIVSGFNDKTIRIWDAETGAAVGQPLTGHTDWVLSVAYSPDGQNIVSGSYDNTIRVWDAQTGSMVGQPLPGHTHYIQSVACSPDSQKIVSGSYDKTVRIWDAQTGMDEARHGVDSHSSHQTGNQLSLTAFSGRAILTTLLDPDGWARGTDGLLFWVPEDCRNGLTCPAITTIPHMGRDRPVRIDFTHFHYGVSWTDIRGAIGESNRISSPSL